MFYHDDGVYMYVVVAFLAASSYGVSSIVQTYEVDPHYSNMTFAEFKEEQVLGEQCRAVDHVVPWKELKRKIRQCRRFEYYVHDSQA